MEVGRGGTVGSGVRRHRCAPRLRGLLCAGERHDEVPYRAGLHVQTQI